MCLKRYSILNEKYCLFGCVMCSLFRRYNSFNYSYFRDRHPKRKEEDFYNYHGKSVRANGTHSITEPDHYDKKGASKHAMGQSNHRNRSRSAKDDVHHGKRKSSKHTTDRSTYWGKQYTSKDQDFYQWKTASKDGMDHMYASINKPVYQGSYI